MHSGRVCVSQLHVHALLIIPALSVCLIPKAEVLLGRLFDSVIISCVSVRRDLLSTTLNTPRIAFFHPCKPSGVKDRSKDGDRFKINACLPFPAVIALYNQKVLAPGVPGENLKKIKP